MKIKDIEYSKVNLKFNDSFSNSQQKFTERELLFLKVTTQNDIVTYGEVSCLPGFAKETVDEVIEFLPEIKSVFTEMPANPFKMEELFCPFAFPTIQYVLEQIVFSYNFKLGKYDAFYLHPKKRKIKLNGLIYSENQDQVMKQVNQFIESGTNVIKIKTGKNLASEIELIRKISAKYSGNIKLRLDANQAWSFEEVEELIKNISAEDIEYLEQPMELFDDCIELARKTNIEIALDETVLAYDFMKHLIHNTPIKTFIVKPTNRNCFMPFLQDKIDAKIVFSSSFESGLSRDHQMFLAANLYPDECHGYNTFHILNEKDYVTPVYSPNNLVIDEYPETLVHFNKFNWQVI